MLAAECLRSDSPFPGLRSFSQDESDLFFGREGQSDELARKLGKTRFVAVVGTSGSGKSSLVRAGLLPSLQSGCLVKVGSNWRIVDMRPGSRPIDNLAAACDIANISEPPVDPEMLRRSSLALLELARGAWRTGRLHLDENLLILVDQFEELFRYATCNNSMDDRDEKAAFVKMLLEVSRQREFQVYVVITMRSDFLGDCARFRDLPETINAGQYLIPRMTRDQRRDAIEGPIHMSGSTITPRLVQRVLNEVGEDPGQLPVMQHALMRTWSHWKNQNQPQQPLDFDNYEAVGTMEKAISMHADEAYDEARSGLGERGATIVRRLFQRISDQDQYGRETRRPTAVQELADVCEASLQQIGDVVESFRKEGRSFLTPLTGSLTPSKEIDITHECLLRKWDRLRGWNREEEESRRVYQRIAVRAQDAVVSEANAADHNRGTEQLFVDYLEGALLDRSVEWWKQRQPNRAWATRYPGRFDLAEKYLWESKKHTARIRFRRLFGRTSATAVVALLIAAGIALFVYKVKSEKETANALAMGALSVFPTTPSHTEDPRVGALLAAASLGVKPTILAQSILISSLDTLPSPLQSLTDDPVFAAEFSPDGKWLAVGEQNRIDLYDWDGVKQKTLMHEGHEGKVNKIVFSGSFEVKAAIEKQIVIWGLTNDYRVVLNCPAEVKDFTVSDDGRTVVALCGDTSESASVYLWKAPNTDSKTLAIERDKLHDHPDKVVAITLNSDGSRLAYLLQTGEQRSVRILEINDRQSVPVTIYESTPGSNFNKSFVSNDIKFAPSGADALITADSDGSVRSWRYSRSEKRPGEKQVTGFVTGKKSEVAASQSNAPESAVLFKLPSAATHLSVSEDGSWITAIDDQGKGRIWDSSRGGEVIQLGLDMPIKSISASRIAQHVAVVSEDQSGSSSLHLWRLGNYLQSVSDASVRSHGRYLITRPDPTSRDPSWYSVVDVASGRAVAKFPGGSYWTYIPLTISHDGKRIAGFKSTGSLVVNDFLTGKMGNQIWQTPEKEALYPSTFAFSANGEYLAGVIDGDGPLANHMALWSMEKNESPRMDLPSGQWVFWDFSPDSQSVFGLTSEGKLHQFRTVDGREVPSAWSGQVLVGSSVDGHTGAAIETANCSEQEDSRAGSSAYSARGRETRAESTIKIFDSPQNQVRSQWTVSGCIDNFWFSQNSEYLVTLDKDKRTVRLWEIASLAERARLRSSEDVLDVDLTAGPKPQIVVVGQAQYTVYSWQPEDLKRELCSRVTHDLTRQEWDQYVGGEDYRNHTTCANMPRQFPRW